MPNKDFYKHVLNSVKDGVYFVDTNRKITFWNKSAENITGFDHFNVVNRHCYDNILNHVDENGKRLCHDGCPLHETLKDGKERSSKVYLSHKDGHRVEVTVYILPIIEEGEIIGAVETFIDHNASDSYSALKESDFYKDNIDELRKLAYKDPLTGLANRRYLDNQIKINIDEHEESGSNFGIILIDIDHFKKFNDSYGHDVGDELLQMISRVFDNSVRGLDFVGRWGGEEFMAVIRSVDHEGLEVIAERIRMLVENSSLRNHDPNLSVTVSVGATLFKAGESKEEMFRRADGLMYYSKSHGRNIVTYG